jgi:hypothetical protein
MTSRPFSRPLTWAVLIGLTATAGILIGLMPAERTLGEAVRIVYAHVALTEAGTLGLYAAGIMGLAVLISGRQTLRLWMQITAGVGLGMLAMGFVVSLAAQQTAWGGIAWQEPRVAAALNVLAIALIVQVLTFWLSNERIRGALNAALAGFVIWSGLNAQGVLHPGAAISTSPSAAIRLSFLALTAVCLLAGAWIVWQAGRDLTSRQ